MRTNNLARHGDLSFRRVKSMPGKSERVESYVLALGETTGHKHLLTGSVSVLNEPDGVYIEVFEPTNLTHEEHKTITFEPGVYKMITEREFNYFDQEINKVRD